MKFLNKDKYIKQVNNYRYAFSADGNNEHWQTADHRWEYHGRVVNMVRAIEFKTILEIGTMGVKIWDDSDTLDCEVYKEWRLIDRPTYIHDLEVLPYPIEDKKYDITIALRVFHHIKEDLSLCLKELMRISSHVIWSLPSGFAYEFIDSVKHKPHIIECDVFDTVILYWKNKIPNSC